MFQAHGGWWFEINISLVSVKMASEYFSDFKVCFIQCK